MYLPVIILAGMVRRRCGELRCSRDTTVCNYSSVVTISAGQSREGAALAILRQKPSSARFAIVLRDSRTEQLVEVVKVAHDVCKLTLEPTRVRNSVVPKPTETAFPSSVGTRLRGRSQRFRRCRRTRSRNVEGYFGGHRRKRRTHHRRTKLCDT